MSSRVFSAVNNYNNNINKNNDNNTELSSSSKIFYQDRSVNKSRPGFTFGDFISTEFLKNMESKEATTKVEKRWKSESEISAKFSKKVLKVEQQQQPPFPLLKQQQDKEKKKRQQEENKMTMSEVFNVTTDENHNPLTAQNDLHNSVVINHANFEDNNRAGDDDGDDVAVRNVDGKDDDGELKTNNSEYVMVVLKNPSISEHYKRVALDCEMVGVGYYGRRLILARVSVVNHIGNVLLDVYVKPSEKVTNYMTEISGIRPEHVEHGANYHWVRRKVLRILRNKILIGHGLENDLRVLNISHPEKLVRDTAKYQPLRVFTPYGQTPSLKNLSKLILGKDIQIGEHDSVEDARSVMFIYNYLAEGWEDQIFHDMP